jgi:prepilin-type processing-associated H-X9-DG protein
MGMSLAVSSDGVNGAGSFIDWTNWSAHALLLGYLEQRPLYNAANFSQSCCFDDGIADSSNSTVYLTRIAGFLCPSDGQAGIQNINSYFGSIGTTVANDFHTVSGIFTLSDPYGTRPCPTIGLNTIADGSSNTIAFGESLVGILGRGNTYRGNGMATGTNPSSFRSTSTGLDVQQKPPAALAAALSDCNAFWKTMVPGTTNHNGAKEYLGQVWALGERQYTLFNTVIPPNSKDNPWSICKLGTKGSAPNESQFINAQSFHPGGANFMFADGSVHFLKDSISVPVYWALGTRNYGEVLSSDSY